MALSASTVWEVRVSGSDTNGGGFVTGAAGTDWSRQDAAQYSVTDAVTDGTTTITSATANFGTDVVGNILYIQGGTGAITAGWYQITVRNSATSITVDRSTGLTTGIGATLTIGGALLSPGIMASVMTVAHMRAFVKAGTYSITSTSNNVAGGCLSAGSRTLVIGYNTTRAFGNTDTQPVIQTNVASATQVANVAVGFNNITFDGNNQTASKHCAGAGRFIGCTIKNFNTISSGTSFYLSCLATANSAAALVGNAFFCESHGNTATPVQLDFAGSFLLSYDNTGASTDGIQTTGPLLNCTSVGNGRDGFAQAANGANNFHVNLISQSNGRYGFRADTTTYLINYASYNNTSGATNGSVEVSFNPIAYTADAFVSVAGDNYGLNNLAGAGAALRAKGMAGLLATYPRGLTESHLDIGAAQHEATGGSVHIIGR
jgi:hypothetical protein